MGMQGIRQSAKQTAKQLTKSRAVDISLEAGADVGAEALLFGRFDPVEGVTKAITEVNVERALGRSRGFGGDVGRSIVSSGTAELYHEKDPIAGLYGAFIGAASPFVVTPVVHGGKRAFRIRPNLNVPASWRQGGLARRP